MTGQALEPGLQHQGGPRSCATQASISCVTLNRELNLPSFSFLICKVGVIICATSLGY